MCFAKQLYHLHSHQQYMRVSIFHILGNILAILIVTSVGMKFYLNVILICSSWKNNIEIFPEAYWPFICNLWGKKIIQIFFFFIFQLGYSYFYYWIMSYSYILNTSPSTDMIYKHFLPLCKSFFPLVVTLGTQKF